MSEIECIMLYDVSVEFSFRGRRFSKMDEECTFKMPDRRNVGVSSNVHQNYTSFRD